MNIFAGNHCTYTPSYQWWRSWCLFCSTFRLCYGQDIWCNFLLLHTHTWSLTENHNEGLRRLQEGVLHAGCQATKENPVLESTVWIWFWCWYSHLGCLVCNPHVTFPSVKLALSVASSLWNGSIRCLTRAISVPWAQCLTITSHHWALFQ